MPEELGVLGSDTKLKAGDRFLRGSPESPIRACASGDKRSSLEAGLDAWESSDVRGEPPWVGSVVASRVGSLAAAIGAGVYGEGETTRGLCSRAGDDSVVDRLKRESGVIPAGLGLGLGARSTLPSSGEVDRRRSCERGSSEPGVSVVVDPTVGLVPSCCCLPPRFLRSRRLVPGVNPLAVLVLMPILGPYRSPQLTNFGSCEKLDSTCGIQWGQKRKQKPDELENLTSKSWNTYLILQGVIGMTFHDLWMRDLLQHRA